VLYDHDECPSSRGCGAIRYLDWASRGLKFMRAARKSQWIPHRPRE